MRRLVVSHTIRWRLALIRVEAAGKMQSLTFVKHAAEIRSSCARTERIGKSNFGPKTCFIHQIGWTLGINETILCEKVLDSNVDGAVLFHPLYVDPTDLQRNTQTQTQHISHLYGDYHTPTAWWEYSLPEEMLRMNDDATSEINFTDPFCCVTSYCLHPSSLNLFHNRVSQGSGAT